MADRIVAGPLQLSSSSPFGAGLFRSDDAGASFRLAGTPPGDLLVSLAADPTDAQTLYAVTAPSGSPTALGERGLFKSRDGGASWSHADRGLPPAITSLLIEPNHPQIVYAGTCRTSLPRASNSLGRNPSSPARFGAHSS